MNKINIKNSNIIAESDKSITIAWRPKRVVHIPKSQVLERVKGARETEFTLTPFGIKLWIKK